MKYSVFTVCMPEVPLTSVPATLARWGYDGVEWRVTDQKPSADGKPSFWAGNLATLSESEALSRAGEMVQLCKDAGIQIVGIAGYRTCADLAALPNLMEATRAMGARHLRVGVPRYDGSVNYNRLFKDSLKQYQRVQKLAEKFGVKANIETHMGLLCASASATVRFVQDLDPKYVGVIYDAGNTVTEGYEKYQAALELLKPYLSYVHVKNAAWKKGKTDPDGTVRWSTAWTRLHQGVVPWDTVFAALRAIGYDGWLSQEDFSSGRAALKLPANLRYLKDLQRRTAK